MPIRLAVTSASDHQLDDLAGASQVLTNGSCFIVGTEPELGDDLLINPALVVLDRQEQVGALFVGELTYSVEVWSASAWCLVPGAWIRMPSSSRMLSNAFRATRSWDPPVSN